MSFEERRHAYAQVTLCVTRMSLFQQRRSVHPVTHSVTCESGNPELGARLRDVHGDECRRFAAANQDLPNPWQIHKIGH